MLFNQHYGGDEWKACDSTSDALFAFAIITMVIQVICWICVILHLFAKGMKLLLECLIYWLQFDFFFNINFELIL